MTFEQSFALDVCEKLIFLLYVQYNWFIYALIYMYVRIRLRQLHLIFFKFSIELFLLIQLKSKLLEFY